MDEADVAGEYQDREIESLLESRQQKRKLIYKDSAENCEECGNEIPSARQIAVPGCFMCIQCAAEIENK